MLPKGRNLTPGITRRAFNLDTDKPSDDMHAESRSGACPALDGAIRYRLQEKGSLKI